MEKDINECLNCGCWDEDMGCTMPSIDMMYACDLYNGGYIEDMKELELKNKERKEVYKNAD